MRALFLDSKKRLWIGSTAGIFYIENDAIKAWKNDSVNLQYAFAFTKMNVVFYGPLPTMACIE